MGKVTVGVVFYPYPRGLPDATLAIDFAQAAEELGFDSIFVGDHVLWRTPILDPLIVLASMSACTKRIKLGTGVYLLPLRQPAVVAKMVASLDYMSGGRTILGVGVGGENPKEFEVCGVPLGERGRRTDEAIEILRLLWIEDSASYAGRHFQFSDIDLRPKPVQKPCPPIWVGGRSEAALRRAARLGDGWLDYFVTVQTFRDCLAKIKEYACEYGRDTHQYVATHFAMASMAGSKQEAKAEAEKFLGTYYDARFGFLVTRYCALGTPEECAAKILPFVDAGANNLILGPACEPNSLLAQLALLAKEVLPRLREGVAVSV